MSLYEPMPQEPEPSREEDCDGFADGLPDVYSLPREGTPAQIRMAMGDLARGLRRVEEDEAREAGGMGRMGKP